jgi:hypothetical protein
MKASEALDTAFTRLLISENSILLSVHESSTVFQYHSLFTLGSLILSSVTHFRIFTIERDGRAKTVYF